MRLSRTRAVVADRLRVTRVARTALVVLAALTAACTDGPPSPTSPNGEAGEGPVPAGPLSRSHPVGEGMSAHAPLGTLPASPAGPEGPTVRRSASAPLPGSGAASVPPRQIAPAGDAPAALATGTHLVWHNASTGQGSSWEMSGTTWTGQFGSLPTIPVVWRVGAAADFNGDGKADLVWQNVSTGERSIWFMNGSTWPGQYALLPVVAPVWQIVGAGDFDGDGKADLVWENTSTGDRSIWFMNGATWNGAYAALPNVPVQWSIAAVEDFDGDRRPDLVWQNTSTGQRSIWLMSGSTWTGAAAILPTVATAWSIAAAGDFNGDGQADLVWQNLSTGDRSIWLMSGATWNGTYAALPNVAGQWRIVAAGNFIGGGAPVTVPSDPSGVAPPAQVSPSTSQITLTWTRSESANETETRIERAPWTTGEGVYTQVGTVGAGVTTYTDAGLTAATRYLYRIRSCNSAGCSDYEYALVAETGPASVTEIGPGTLSNLASTSGRSLWYSLVLPAGASATVATSGGTGDLDLAVWHGAGQRDCLSAGVATGEQCTVAAGPSATTFYVQLFAYAAYTGVTLTVSGTPNVVTNPATGVTSTSAELHGDVNQDGTPYTVFFEWGTSPTLATSSAGGGASGPNDACPATTTCSWGQPVSGLLPGTTYYFRIVATNAAGTSRGAIASFRTP